MKKNHLLVIIGLFLFYAVNNYIWLSQNKLAISYDEGIHLWTNLRFVRALTHPMHNIFYELFHANATHWPPLFHFIASIFNIIFGTSYVVSVMTNILFFLLLIISLYLIGKKIYSPSSGILAAMIVSFYPIIYGHSRLFLLDFPLTAIVTFSVYCLISADNFRSSYWSIILGVAIGLGMLIKWTYIFFVLPLFIYEAIECLRDIENKDFLNRAKNFLISLMISFLISSIWYILHLGRSRYALGYLEKGIMSYTSHFLKEAQYFILAFNNNMLSFPFFFLFIVCLLVFYIKINSKFKLFITTWYLVPLVILSFVNWKQSRFFMPVLPCFALISAITLDSLKNKKVKFLLISFIFMIGMMQYFNVSFNPNTNREVNKSNSMLGNIDMLYKGYVDSFSILGAAPPRRTGWKHRDIAKAFSKHAQEFKNYPFLIGIIINDKDKNRLKDLFSNRIMNRYLIEELDNSDIIFGPEVALDLNYGYHVKEYIKFIENISDMTGIVYISRDAIWPDFDVVEDIIREPSVDARLAHMVNSKDKFRFIERIELPDNYYANIFIYDTQQIDKEGFWIKIFNGKVKLFYGEKEITKDVGLVCEFVYNNRTYKYKDALWNIHNISPYQVMMVSEWPDAGIVQSILVSMDPDKKDRINIAAKLKAVKNVILDDWYINNLISDDYKEWLRPFSKGIFEEISIFSDPNHFEPLDLGYKGPNIVGIKEAPKKQLPAVLFKCRDVDLPVRLGISNTNYYHNARCVWITADSKIILKAGHSKDILDVDISILDDSRLKRVISGIEKKLLLGEESIY